MKLSKQMAFLLISSLSIFAKASITTENIAGTYDIKGKDVCIHVKLTLDGQGRATLTNQPPCGQPSDGACNGTYEVLTKEILKTSLECVNGANIQHTIDLSNESSDSLVKGLKNKAINLNLNGQVIDGLTFDVKKLVLE